MLASALPGVLFYKNFKEFSYRAVAPVNPFSNLILPTLIYVSPLMYVLFASRDIH